MGQHRTRVTQRDVWLLAACGREGLREAHEGPFLRVLTGAQVVQAGQQCRGRVGVAADRRQ